MNPRVIVIKPVLNGYSVEVGCQTLAFDSRSKMLSELAAYLEDPKKKEVEFRRNAMHPMKDEGMLHPAEACNAPVPVPRPTLAQDFQPQMVGGGVFGKPTW